ncbi:hypothetical protein [Candidatus Thioglobus sp.]|jgi:hypothetical protein|uniref:hypothetical protein n=1 Tax=Candidatus Thioglobus sp. TaxID=2026721 RepID=UPI0017773135|nr:hypothetical protein [Candidatus Thioglobus sp.]HIB28363.1 hypothetical protein [Candidatus Thioglobus sp.]HIB97914.1 hypothetical protein [Candidatus Thioglobus sp.]HIF47714.1 hypothetical protein [Candidatus Thioglobus sp.]HIL03596.1 hypothetical protein [Candidatus Thioglobus autotrophicus]
MIIKIDASSQERREAKAAHELFTINAILVHVIGSLGLIKLLNTSLNIAIGLTVMVSMAIILYTYFRTKKAKVDDVYLVYIHWQMSLNRYKILISAYVFYFLITSLGMVIGDNNVSSMDGTSIIESILTLLGIVPLFFAVLISAVLGSGSMFNAGRGEVDQKIAQKYPQ